MNECVVRGVLWRVQGLWLLCAARRSGLLCVGCWFKSHQKNKKVKMEEEKTINN